MALHDSPPLSADTAVAGALGCMLILASGISAIYEVPLIRSAPAVLLAFYFVVRILAHGLPARILAWHWVLLAWVCLLAAGILYTRSPEYAAWKTVIVALYWVALAIAFSCTFTRRESARWFLGGMLIGGALYTVLVLVYAGSPLAIARNLNLFFRLKLGLQNPIYVARTMGLSVLVALWFCTGRAHGAARFAAAAAIPVPLVYMVLTGSKGPALALGAGAAVFMGIRVRRRLAVIPAVAVVLTAVAVLARTPWLRSGNLRLLDLGVLSLQRRLASWHLALDGFSRSSFLGMLFGNGTGDFSHLDLGVDVRQYPHNILLESLYENGLFGAALLVAALLLPILVLRDPEVASRLRADADFRNVVSVGLAILVFAIVNAQFTGDLATNTWIPIAGALLVSLRQSARKIYDPLRAP